MTFSTALQLLIDNGKGKIAQTCWPKRQWLEFKDSTWYPDEKVLQACTENAVMTPVFYLTHLSATDWEYCCE